MTGNEPGAAGEEPEMVTGSAGSAVSVTRDGSPRTAGRGADVGSGVAPMLAVYRHDVHKLRGRSHNAAAEEVAGVRVNEGVPLGADRDAALLSRPRGEPEETVANHQSPYRFSNDRVPARASVTADGQDHARDGGRACGGEKR